MAGSAHAPIRARWFDGRSSQAQPVAVTFEPAAPGRRGPDLWLHLLSGESGGSRRRVRFADVAWPEVWSARQVQRTILVDLKAHGSLEVDDAGAWHAALADAGGRPSLAQRMQTRWPVMLAVLLVAVTALALFYRDGTPWMATQLTRFVPLAWETDLSARVLQELDDAHLKPTQLPVERQARLRQGFDRLVQNLHPGLQRDPGYAPAWRLMFRSGMGANAFALPGGTVVVTDGLVQRAARDGLDEAAVLGVLAHEVGHVVHRHTTRMVVEQGVLNIGLGLALGDASVILSTGSSLLTGLAYRRQHEAEADCFSVRLMHEAGLPMAPMADLLLAIDGGGPRAAQNPRTREPSAASGAWTLLLSTHPDTGERARRLRQAQPGGC